MNKIMNRGFGTIKSSDYYLTIIRLRLSGISVWRQMIICGQRVFLVDGAKKYGMGPKNARPRVITWPLPDMIGQANYCHNEEKWLE